MPRMLRKISTCTFGRILMGGKLLNIKSNHLNSKTKHNYQEQLLNANVSTKQTWMLRTIIIK